MLWIVWAVVLLAFSVQLFNLLGIKAGVLRTLSNKADASPASSIQPPVSVLVYTRDQAGLLETMLPALLTQAYPNYQIIVVNDASEDETEDVLKRLAVDYPQLYHTFVPKGIQQVSSQLMALTLAIKAASFEQLLFTRPDALPVSPYWIAEMMAEHSEASGLVLGYANVPNGLSLRDSTLLYDGLIEAVKVLGWAKRGAPYRAFPANVGFSKSLFFNNKGYASLLNGSGGVDDVYIQMLSKQTHTRIVAQANARIVWQGDSLWQLWRTKKGQQWKALSRYPFRNRLKLSLDPISQLFLYAALLLVFLLNRTSLMSGQVAVALLVVMSHQMLLLMIPYLTAKRMNLPLSLLRLCVGRMFRPFLLLRARFGCWFSKATSLTD